MIELDKKKIELGLKNLKKIVNNINWIIMRITILKSLILQIERKDITLNLEENLE